MNLALINSVLFRAYSKLEICTENYYCLVILKFYEPYLLLTNDYKHSVELFMHSKQITRIQQLQRYSV